MFTRRLVRLASFLLLLLWLAAPAHAGRGDGQLTVTLRDHTGAPVAGEPLTFLTGDKQPLATCTTDAAGVCTLILASAPTDPSGFIRGSVLVGESRRSVIWPGGALAIEIEQDALGYVNPPADVYTVHDPVATLAAEATLAALPEATGAGGQGPGPQAAPTQAATARASSPTRRPATQTPSATATSVPVPTELAALALEEATTPLEAAAPQPTRSPVQNVALAIAVCLISAAFVLLIAYTFFPERVR